MADVTTISNLRPVLLPVLCTYADGYFAGHDHHLQVDVSGCGLVHVLSGAGAKSDLTFPHLIEDTKATLKFSKGETLGFSHITLDDDSANIKMIDQDATVLTSVTFKRRSHLEHKDFVIEKFRNQLPKINLDVIRDILD